jgi:hypothetical protein
MCRTGSWALAIVLAMLTAMVMTAAAGDAPEVELTGEINEIYQFVTDDGEIYEIGINDVGNELVDSHINEKVRVRGAINTAEDGARVITVTSFEVISE